jgi:hypothetical protein
LRSPNLYIDRRLTLLNDYLPLGFHVNRLWLHVDWSPLHVGMLIVRVVRFATKCAQGHGTRRRPHDSSQYLHDCSSI